MDPKKDGDDIIEAFALTLPVRSGDDALQELALTLPVDSAEAIGGQDTLVADSRTAALLDDPGQSLTPETPGRYVYKGSPEQAEIGRGGIGRVLVAVDRHLGREIAVKELLVGGDSDAPAATPATTPGGSRTPPLAARFLREARVTGQLEHPNIVPVHEIGRRDEGSYYYTMKLVRGRTLAAALRRCTSLFERLALLPHYLDLCQAIAYAHSRGVIHRDIKTENTMVGEFGETVVLDWGLAKVRGAKDLGARDLERDVQLYEGDAGQTVDGAALGTPSYMSPEQAEGTLTEVDEQSDVWSLGAVLYEVLTGEPPFRGETARQVLRRVRTETVTPPRVLDDAIPPELASVCEKALQRQKVDRYASARAVATEIQAYLSGARVSAYEYSSWELLRRFVTRNRALSAASLLLFLSLIVGSILVYRSWQGAEKARQGESNARVRAERSQRDEQRARHIAQQQRRQAVDKERQALANLARAFIYRAQVIEKAHRHGEARVYYAAALARRDDPAARSGLYRFYTAPLHARLGLNRRLSSAPPRRVVLAPDGKRAAVSSCLAPLDDRFCKKSRIELFDLSSGRKPAQIDIQGDLGWAMRFTPDGRHLAAAHCQRPARTGCHRNTLGLWSVKTGRRLRTLPAPLAWIMDVAVSPDGQRLAAVGCQKLSGQGGSRCPTGGVLLYRSPTDPTPARLAGHTRNVHAVRFAPDGQRLVTVSLDRCARIWSVPQGRELRALCDHPAEIYGLALSPDSRLLATGTDSNEIFLWQLDTGKRLTVLRGHRDSVLRLAFSPDGRYLASAGDDQAVLLWDLSQRLQISTLAGYLRPLESIAFGVDSRHLATASRDGVLRTWDLRPGQPVRTCTGHTDWVRALVVLPGGTALSGSLDGTVRTCPAPMSARPPLRTAPVTALAALPNGTIAIGGQRGELRLWRQGSEARPLVSTPAHAAAVRAIRLSPDGRRLATAAEDRTIKLWDPTRRRLIRSFDSPSVKNFAVAFLAPDRLVSGGAEPLLRFWSASKGQARAPLKTGSPVRALRLSPDRRTLAVGLETGAIRLYDARTWKVRRELTGHGRLVLDLAWSPKGRYLASASGDRTARLWDPATGRQLYAMQGHRMYVWSVAFTPDGRALYTTSGDHTVRRWPLLPAVFTRSAKSHLDQAVRETGLRVRGFEIVPVPPTR